MLFGSLIVVTAFVGGAMASIETIMCITRMESILVRESQFKGWYDKAR